jgi:catechol 2,3-dioxygenase-like lactoylglutathione lyase family enzyme
MTGEAAGSAPRQTLAQVAIVVRDYDEALAFYVGVLGFARLEDTPLPQENKRWVVVAPPGAPGAKLLLARAATPEQALRIGNQTGGRVFLFLHTDNCRRDYERYRRAGVKFVRPMSEAPHGRVAVFEDLYGNLWDLIEPRGAPAAAAADAAEVVERFIARINAHDVAGLLALCTPAHLFIDSLGNALSGPAALSAGWTGYFGLFRDYRIEVQSMVAGQNLVFLSGWAQGSHAASGRSFRIPAAWRAQLESGRIAQWQVYADNKPVYEILQGSTGPQER